MCSINTWAAKVSVQPHTLYSLQQPRICTPVQQRTGVSPPLSQHTHHSVDQSPWRGQQHAACPWPGPQLWSRINNKLYLHSRSDVVIIVGTRLGPDICSSSPESRGEHKTVIWSGTKSPGFRLLCQLPAPSSRTGLRLGHPTFNLGTSIYYVTISLNFKIFYPPLKKSNKQNMKTILDNQIFRLASLEWVALFRWYLIKMTPALSDRVINNCSLGQRIQNSG